MKTPTSTLGKQQNKTLISIYHILRRFLPLRPWRKGLGVGFGMLFLFFSLSLNAQVTIEWQKCYGGTFDDKARSIVRTADGGFIVAGSTYSDDGDVSGNHGFDDAWIVKLDGAGNLQWQNCYGGSDNDNAVSVKQTFDGGYIFAGSTLSNDGNVSGNHGFYDYWIIKLNNTGTIQWKKCFGGSDIDLANCIVQTADSGYIVAGSSSSTDGNVTGNHGALDYWVVKISSAGTIEWKRSLGGSNSETAKSIIQTTDGGYVVFGHTSSNDGNVSGNHGLNDYWAVKLNSMGNIQWKKCYGGTNNETAASIISTLDGGYLLVGGSNSNDGDISFNYGNYDYWIVKLDSAGNVKWQKSYGGSSDEEAKSVFMTTDGGYIIAGYSSSGNGNVSVNLGSFDFWIVKIDVTGNILWEKSIGGLNEDYPFDMVQLADGSYVLTGSTNSNNGNVSGNHGDFDYWVVKLTEHYNLITGNLFYDANNNNIKDAGEPSLSNRKVNEPSTGRFGFSGANGTYYVAVLDSGNYTVSPEPLNYFSSAPLSHSAYFSSIQQTDSLNDFAIQPSGMFNDLCVTITPLTNFRQGMNASYVINFSNAGTTLINNCSIIFLPDINLTYLSSNTSPASVFPDSVIWSIGTLAPFQTGNIMVTVNVNVGTPIGTPIVSGVRIDPVAGDANPACNYNYWEVLTTGAVDPNDILVNRATLLTTEFPNPPFLDYLIRFQNVGNDTAFTVRIYNPIDTSKLDVNTLDFVSSSHPVDMRYKFHERIMEFKFENIQLPDSTTNEPLSHGFIRYKIKPRSTLVLNDTIPNFAVIHFDFEKPVLTNTAITTVVSPTNLSPGLAPQESGVLSVWPNPASDEVTISFTNPISSAPVTIRVYDLTGRTVMEEKNISFVKNSITFNIASLNKGMYLVEMGVNGVSHNNKLVILHK